MFVFSRSARREVLLACRSYRGTPALTDPLKVVIVGSGPSGCYTAKYLQSSRLDVKIDVLEKLPTPFGLVRSGVAPDHPEVKNAQNDFAAIFERGETSFFGNVTVGKDVSVEELRQIYDAVVLAYGCESDRKLGIPGEDTLKGVLSAREFVAWYNGHPDFVHLGEQVAAALGENPIEDAEVVVVGQGNVALDCARVLAKGGTGLYHTDIAAHALPVLKDGVKKTTVLGRRGHVQGAFTIKEVRELTKLDDEGHQTSFIVSETDLQMGTTESSKEELNGPQGRPKQRIDKLLRDAASAPTRDNPKQVFVRFLLNPLSFNASSDDPSTLGSVTVERTRLEGEPGQQIAVGTGETETIDAQLALVSIGYKGVALPGIDAFDARRGVVLNKHGKVDGATDVMGGLYAAGWLKRGPSGIIGTNITDAKDTVASIVTDFEGMQIERPSRQDLHSLLLEREVQVVDWKSYNKIDKAETDVQRRRSDEQPREKIPSISEMLEIASKI